MQTSTFPTVFIGLCFLYAPGIIFVVMVYILGVVWGIPHACIRRDSGLRHGIGDTKSEAAEEV